MYVNIWIDLMLKRAVQEKKLVSLGINNLDIWKSNLETGRGKLLQGVCGYYQ